MNVKQQIPDFPKLPKSLWNRMTPKEQKDWDRDIEEWRIGVAMSSQIYVTTLQQKNFFGTGGSSSSGFPFQIYFAGTSPSGRPRVSIRTGYLPGTLIRLFSPVIEGRSYYVPLGTDRGFGGAGNLKYFEILNDDTNYEIYLMRVPKQSFAGGEPQFITVPNGDLTKARIIDNGAQFDATPTLNPAPGRFSFNYAHRLGAANKSTITQIMPVPPLWSLCNYPMYIAGNWQDNRAYSNGAVVKWTDNVFDYEFVLAVGSMGRPYDISEGPVYNVVPDPALEYPWFMLSKSPLRESTYFTSVTYSPDKRYLVR